MKTIVMTDRFGYQKDLEEIQNEWLENLLLYLGVDIQIMNVQDPQYFSEYLVINKIEIIENLNDGSMQVQHSNEDVGIWKAPVLVLKSDEGGGLYYEITLDYWTISEEDITI